LNLALPNSKKQHTHVPNTHFSAAKPPTAQLRLLNIEKKLFYFKYLKNIW
jgi:hypothetical protein